MDDVLKQRILQQCVAIKADVSAVRYRQHGLCLNIKEGIDISNRYKVGGKLVELFKAWPEYSGNPHYPVPHPDMDHDYDTDEDAAEGAYEHRSMWSGPYGEARARLLDFIIQTLSEELHNAV